MSDFQIVQPEDTAPVSPPQAGLGNLSRKSYHFLFPPSFFRQPLQERMDLFSHLETLDADTKEALQIDVTVYMERLTALDVFMDRVKIFSRWLLLFLGVVFALVSFPIAQWAFGMLPPPFTASSGSILVILTILCYILLMLLFILPNFFKVASVKWLFCWHIMVSLGYMILFVLLSRSNTILNTPGIASYASYIVLIALIGNLGFEFVYFFVVTFLVVLGPLALERWRAAHYPLATIIYQLIRVLRSLEQSKHCSTIDLYERRKQLAEIEIASRCLESFLPAQLRCGDIVTDAWLKEVMQEAANALREKKRWLLTPKIDTYGYLTRSLALMLTCVIRGDWDSLERVKYAQLAHPHVWQMRIFHTIRLITQATLPLLIGLVLVVFHPLSDFFMIPRSIESYFILGPLFWALITLVEALDPNFNDKVNSIKNVLSIFPK